MKKIIAYITITVVLSACGYHFKSRAISINNTDYFTLVIVKNETFQPQLKQIIKDDLTKEFTAYGWLRSKSDFSRSAVFVCKVVEFEDNPVSYTANDDISQYEAVLLFDVNVYKGSPSNVFYSLKGRRYSQNYLVSPDIKVTLRNKTDAIKKISEQFSSDILDLISEGF